jgi:quercetin dioxygenase-like cupin family protein
MFSAALVDAVVGAASTLAYSAATVGEAFYENYGWTEFAGVTGPVSSQRLACGVLLLGPQATYPPHRHEAEEIYVPLAGTAKWSRGNESWHERLPGNVIHHARHESHAMQTGPQPLLALYLWRSQNLAQSSHLDSPQA